MKKIVSIVGLTASGKSEIGIKLAQLFNGEIISCDSRQIYRGLDIGSAKVTKAQQELVPHHMLDIVQPGEHFDVFMFQQATYKIIDAIWARGKLPILVGGTGLYSRSVIQNYGFKNSKEKETVTIKGNDNTTSPRPIWVKGSPLVQVALMPPKEWLQPRIQKRNQERLDMGMLQEVQGLLDTGVTADWLKSLGLDYEWTTKLALGEVTLDEFKHWLTIRTMQYAKRQRTWFKREKNTIFLETPETFEKDCVQIVREFVLDRG